MDEILQVVSEELDGVPVIRAIGEIDVSSAPLLRRHLAEIPATNPIVIVDLSEVTFLDSTGIGVLVGALGHIRETHSNGALHLVVTHPHIAKVLEVTGLTAIFPVFSSPTEAIAAR